VNYRTRIVSSLAEIGQPAWDALVAMQSDANPFLSFAFLHAMHQSGSASASTGWRPQYLTLWRENQHETQLEAAIPLYAKSHSYGEYVFDWAWADAYPRNGRDY
jgi:predicted N-acyltransferase